MNHCLLQLFCEISYNPIPCFFYNNFSWCVCWRGPRGDVIIYLPFHKVNSWSSVLIYFQPRPPPLGTLYQLSNKSTIMSLLVPYWLTDFSNIIHKFVQVKVEDSLIILNCWRSRWILLKFISIMMYLQFTSLLIPNLVVVIIRP